MGCFKSMSFLSYYRNVCFWCDTFLLTCCFIVSRYLVLIFISGFVPDVTSTVLIKSISNIESLLLSVISSKLKSRKTKVFGMNHMNIISMWVNFLKQKFRQTAKFTFLFTLSRIIENCYTPIEAKCFWAKPSYCTQPLTMHGEVITLPFPP